MKPVIELLIANNKWAVTRIYKIKEGPSKNNWVKYSQLNYKIGDKPTLHRYSI